MNKISKYALIFTIFISNLFQLGIYAQEAFSNEELKEKTVSYVDAFIAKDAKLQKMGPAPETGIYMPSGSSQEKQEKLKRIAAYDVGSTGVKFKLMDVDPATQKIENVIYSTYVQTKFEIKEEDFLDRIAIMAGLKTLVEEYFPHFSKIEHYGIATAGFRAAGERGLRLAKEITDLVGIDFKVIDQNDEGLLAYYGVLAQESKFNLSKDIVWDIGGGSSQLIGSEVGTEGKEKMKFLGVAIGGAKFNEIVVNAIFGGDKNSNANRSENPMAPETIKDFIDKAKTWLIDSSGPFMPAVFSQEDVDFIKAKVANNANIYGIGAIHNFVAKVYANNNFGAKPYYTKEELSKLLDMIANQDDDAIYANIKKNKEADPQFTKTDVTSLMLVYAMMDFFGIDKIHPVNVSNADGIAIKAIVDNKHNKNPETPEDKTKSEDKSKPVNPKDNRTKEKTKGKAKAEKKGKAKAKAQKKAKVKSQKKAKAKKAKAKGEKKSKAKKAKVKAEKKTIKKKKAKKKC